MNAEPLVINKDECPKTENVLYQGQCTGCQYYVGFEVCYGQQCIKCSYSDD